MPRLASARKLLGAKLRNYMKLLQIETRPGLLRFATDDRSSFWTKSIQMWNFARVAVRFRVETLTRWLIDGQLHSLRLRTFVLCFAFLFFLWNPANIF